MTKIDWLAQRRQGLSGTDIAAIMNLNPYKSPIDVYLDKVEGTEVKENALMRRGSDLEPYVADRFAQETGFEVVVPEFKIYTHPKVEYFKGSPDRFYIDGDKKVLEIKTTGQGFTELPQNYYLQTMWYVGILDLPGCAISILSINDWELTNYYYDRNDEIIKIMEDVGKEFWNNNILLRQVPEPIDNSDLLKLYKTHVPEKVYELSEDEFKLFQTFEKRKKADSKLDKIVEQAKTDFLVLVKDAEVIQYKGQTLCTVKTQTTNRFDSESFRKEHGDLYKQYQKQSSYPVLRIK